ncbi:MAG TPA: DUF1127 domain-containing protein [Pseudolabrys sp.]|jgi:uncharacterized protein YjiS (DUF1127 family)|nr:DUF1127 domain-containing protein [Pseudolabrys sp.]
MSCGSAVCSSAIAVQVPQRRAKTHRSFADLAVRWIVYAIECQDRWRQRQALLELDERLLRDIGISREQAIREANKPIWK